MSTQTEVYGNPGIKIDAKVKRICAEKGLDYAEALRIVRREEPELWHRYTSGESDLDREVKKGSEEFSRRVKAYSEEWNLTKDEAERRVRAHDPNMRPYSTDRGGLTMNTEKIPLSAESVVDARAQERMEAGKAKGYNEAVRQVLDADEHLKYCYTAGKPYIEAARKYVEDPMRAPEIRAITEPRPDAILTPAPEKPPPQFANTARLRLGALLAGAKAVDGGIDIPLALNIANLVPDEVKAAAGEALDEITRALTGRADMPAIGSQAYPGAYRIAVAEHPELWSASQSGTLTEEGLRDLFIQWFK